MRSTKKIASAAAIVAAFAFAPPAKAGSEDAIIAGGVGFAIGTLFGSAATAPRYYVPGPVYVAPRPVYVAPQPIYVEPPVVYEVRPAYYPPAPWSPDWYAYCASRYGSFDPDSGTFIGHDGYRRMCR